jgi:predicted Zn-dependent protease
MRTKKRYAGFLLLFLLAAWLITCAVNPVTGKRELMLLSEADELTLGKQTDEEVVATYGVYSDAKLEAYINEIGQRMKGITHRPGLPYQFKVLDTPVINAFAVPGGYVYFTRGILAYLNDEAELAGVLGHELGHVNARHTAQQYSRAQLAQLGLGIGMVLSEDFRKYAGVANFGVNLLFLRFSRDNERQADDLGVEYSSRTGYDAYRMAEFFNTLERMNPSSGANALPEWFSTHPNPVDRIGAVRRKTAEWQQKLVGQTFVTNRDRYLGTVDNIVFGEDPRQGYVAANTFYHPVMLFSFPVPESWQVNNTPNQVQLVSPKQDAVIMLAAASGTSPQQAAKSFIESSHAMVHAADALSVNGFSAQRVSSDVPTDQDTLRVLSYFIQKSNMIYAFHGFTQRNLYSSYSNVFNTTMGQFKTLTDPKRIQVTPTRLTVKGAKAAGTCATALRGLGVVDGELDKLAILNGKQLQDAITPQTLLKVVAGK